MNSNVSASNIEPTTTSGLALLAEWPKLDFTPGGGGIVGVFPKRSISSREGSEISRCVAEAGQMQR